MASEKVVTDVIINDHIKGYLFFGVIDSELKDVHLKMISSPDSDSTIVRITVCGTLESSQDVLSFVEKVSRNFGAKMIAPVESEELASCS